MPNYPFNLRQFFEVLPVVGMSFDLSESMRTSETGGGQIVTASMGPRLWEGEVQVARQPHADLQGFRALANSVRQPNRPFRIRDLTRTQPAADTEGEIKTEGDPVITAIGSDNSRLTMEGLPPGYVLTEGDLLSFSYGTNPTRFALHEVTQGNTANSSGVMGWVHVAPFIRPGASSGLEVRLHRPFCLACYVPGSFKEGKRGAVMTEGFSFRFRQTL